MLTTIYVDVASSGAAHNGSSWQSAYTDLQSALSVAVSGDEIHVADGTYKPTSTTNRALPFQLKNGVVVAGGYAGYGAVNPDTRDVAAHPTVLSGNIGISGSAADNSYHVVVGSGVGTTAILDGFIVRDGNANGSTTPTQVGGGMYNSSGSPTVRNCAFTSNLSSAGGAGLYNASSSSSFSNCTFSFNSTAGSGGGMFCSASPVSLSSCTFTSNNATANGGGMMGSAASVTDCTFTSNTAAGGAGLYCSGTSAIANCSFSRNTGTNGSGLYIAGPSSAPTVTSCTFAFNASTNFGGGLFDEPYTATPVITNCAFTSNSASAGGGAYLGSGAKGNYNSCSFVGNAAVTGGGGIYSNASNSRLTNCVIADNSTRDCGGAFYFDSVGATAYPILTNCTLSGNYAPTAGGGVFNDSRGSAAPPRFVNCIITANTAPLGASICNFNGNTIGIPTKDAIVTYSDVELGYAGVGNLDVDPLFLRAPSSGADGNWGTSDDDAGDLRLSAASPVVDRGNNQSMPAGITTDLAGNGRFVDVPTTSDLGLGSAPFADLGAYEVSPTLSARAGRPSTVVSGHSLTLSAHGASSASGTLQYAWEWTGDGQFDDAEGANPAFPVAAFSDGSTVSVSLRITDSNSQSLIDTTSVKIVPAIVYVDGRATAGAGDGLSWTNAFTALSAALSQAVSGQTLRVAQGTYRPTNSTDRTQSFVLRSGVLVFGGYRGLGGGDPNQRDVSAFPTTLSGDIGTTGTNVDNSYHVLNISGTDSTAMLDGVNVIDGNANGMASVSPVGASAGGGIYNVAGSATLRWCAISGNRATTEGGGLYNYYTANPTFIDCTFAGNASVGNAASASSTDGGGAIFSYSSNLTLLRCTFQLNAATSTLGGGGALYNYASSAYLTDCTFVRNTATNNGGAVLNDTFSRFSDSSPVMLRCVFEGNSALAGGAAFNGAYSQPKFTNSLFSGNSAGQGGVFLQTDQSRVLLYNCTIAGNRATTQGGVIYAYSSTVFSIYNSILWGNTAPSSSQIYFGGGLDETEYCDIQGGYAGFHPMNSDPQFIRNPSPGLDGIWNSSDDDYGDLRLQSTSPCIDAASNGDVPAGTTTDLSGHPRLFDFPGSHDPGGIVDIGAYELDYRLASITVGALQSLSLPPGRHAFEVEQLVVDASGKLDVRDDDLIVNYSWPSPIGSWGGSAYTGLLGSVESGRNGGTWNGNGIVTSSASGNLTALGIAEALQAIGISGTQTALFEGQTVDATTVLVKYTYGGDANLDGRINVDDYTRIDFNVRLGSTGWFNGDFNYDGKINVDDYTIIDFNVGIQGPPLSSSTALAKLLPASAEAIRPPLMAAIAPFDHESAMDLLTADVDPLL